MSALVLQSSVLTFAALTIFYPPWRKKFSKLPGHNDLRFRLVYFIFTAVGALLLFLALFITAYKIGHPHLLVRYGCKPKPPKVATKSWVIWAQREDDSLGTERYILAKEIKKEMVSVHRPNGASLHSSDKPDCCERLCSYLTAGSIVAGFLLQSIGLSQMHWPTQCLQFLSISIMFGLRYWLHRQSIAEVLKPGKVDNKEAYVLAKIKLTHFLPDVEENEVEKLLNYLYPSDMNDVRSQRKESPEDSGRTPQSFASTQAS